MTKKYEINTAAQNYFFAKKSSKRRTFSPKTWNIALKLKENSRRLLHLENL